MKPNNLGSFKTQFIYFFITIKLTEILTNVDGCFDTFCFVIVGVFVCLRDKSYSGKLKPV